MPPVLGLALGAALISLAPVFVKWIAPQGLGPTAIAFWRMALGAGMLWILASRHRGVRASPRAFAMAVVAGFCFAADLFCWHRSILTVGAGMATILANTQVFWVALVGVAWLGERPGWRLWAGVGLGIAGITALSGVLSGAALSAVRQEGLLLGLLTGVFYTGFILSLRRAGASPGGLPSEVATLVLSLAAASALGGAGLIEGGPMRPPTPAAWGLLLGLAAIGQLLGWVLIARNLPRVPASRAGLLLLLQPTLAMVWGALLFPEVERLDGVQVAGCVLSLAGIYLGGCPTR